MRRVAVYVLLYLLLVAAVAVAFGSGRVRVGDDGLETSVKWGGRVLDSREEISSWLSARGATYEEWARKHPVAATRVEHRGAPVHVALQWPPALHGEIPRPPGAVLGAGAALVALAAAAFLGRRRIARAVGGARASVRPGLAAAAFGDGRRIARGVGGTRGSDRPRLDLRAVASTLPIATAVYAVFGAITAAVVGFLVAAALTG